MSGGRILPGVARAEAVGGSICKEKKMGAV